MVNPRGHFWCVTRPGERPLRKNCVYVNTENRLIIPHQWTQTDTKEGFWTGESCTVGGKLIATQFESTQRCQHLRVDAWNPSAVLARLGVKTTEAFPH